MTRNKNTGNQGELIAAKYLKNKGYTIKATNLRLSNLEIDLVGEKDGAYYLVEVKTSHDNPDFSPEDLLKKKKLDDMQRAAWLFSVKEKIPLAEINIDLITISLNYEQKMAKIRHFKNIF